MFGCTTNGSLVTDPSGVSSCTAPVIASGGTVATTWVSSTIVKVAATPPNETAVVPDSPVPVSVTLAPTGPRVGSSAIGPGWAWAARGAREITSAAVIKPTATVLPRCARTRGCYGTGGASEQL